jgi:hypothetical protein
MSAAAASSSQSSKNFTAPVKLEFSNTGALQSISVSNTDDLDQIANRYGLGEELGRAAKRQRAEDGSSVHMQSSSQAAVTTVPLLQRKSCSYNKGVVLDAAIGYKIARMMTISTSVFRTNTVKIDGIQYILNRRIPENPKAMDYPELKRLQHLRVHQCACMRCPPPEGAQRGEHCLMVLTRVSTLRNVTRLMKGEALDSKTEENPALMADLRRFAATANRIYCEKIIAIMDEVGLE